MIENSQHSTANGIEKTVSQIEKVVTASLRALPTETGDGSYVKEPTATGLVKDLGHFDLKDVKTLAEVAKSAVTGDPVNDKEYIMERVIQVGYFHRCPGASSIAKSSDSLLPVYLPLLGMGKN